MLARLDLYSKYSQNSQKQNIAETSENYNMKQTAKQEKKIKTPLLGKVLQKIAPRIGAKVDLEPRWGIVGRISYPNGKVRFFRYTTIDINTMGASEIARDKDYAKFFLKMADFNVIPGKGFCSKEWARKIGSRDTEESAFTFAEKLELPVIVKPNSKSQGAGVVKVYTKKEFIKAFRSVSQYDNIVLVEKFIAARDYRIVVLDNKVISAYERIALSVTGNGRSSILGLLKKKQELFNRAGRDTCIKFKEPRMIAKLKKQGLTLSSKPKLGEIIQLLDNANLSTGGDSLDVTEDLHPTIAKLAIDITRKMGLRLCGVDLMLSSGATSTLVAQKYWVIEINSAPGLDHYAAIGKKQQKIVEDLYLEVLKAMAK